MKPWMKVLMWFGLGAGIGFFAGMQYGQNKQEREMPEEEPERVPEAYTEAIRDYGGDTDGDSCWINIDCNNNDTFTTLDEILRKPATDEEPEMPKVEELAIDQDDVPQLHPQHEVPEIIGEEEFNRNIWHYDIENLLFYEMDEVLYNETTQSIVEYPDAVIGHGTLFEFGGDPNNPVYTIYVKNDTYGTIFRIESIDAAFCDSVDGTCGPSEDDDDDDFWNDV